MTVWNDAAYTERLAHANWMANTAVLMHLNERATGDPARDWLSSWAHRWFVGRGLRVLVLGCGEGWLERAVAGWPFPQTRRLRARVDVHDEAVSHRGAVSLRRNELERLRPAEQHGIFPVARHREDLRPFNGPAL